MKQLRILTFSNCQPLASEGSGQIARSYTKGLMKLGQCGFSRARRLRSSASSCVRAQTVTDKRSECGQAFPAKCGTVR